MIAVGRDDYDGGLMLEKREDCRVCAPESRSTIVARSRGIEIQEVRVSQHLPLFTMSTTNAIYPMVTQASGTLRKMYTIGG